MPDTDCHTLWIDRSHHLPVSCKIGHQLSTIALTFCSSCLANYSKGDCRRWHHGALIALAADHQLPGYARNLVGKRNRHKLGLFPLEQARIIQLLVRRVTVTAAGLEVDIRREGVAGVIREMIAPRDIEAAE